MSMSTCSKCSENNDTLKNDVIVEVLKILSAIISTDGTVFDKEVEKYNINEDLVCALKVFRDLNVSVHDYKAPVLNTATMNEDENEEKIRNQQLEIDHLRNQQSKNIAAYNKAKQKFKERLKSFQLENKELKEEDKKKSKQIQSLFDKADGQEQYC